MNIGPNTRISVLLKENKACIEAIASLSKPLEKLRNPILRRIMASRVTIAEAAKMGSVGLEDFTNVLRPLGFEFENTTIKRDSITERPPWLEQLLPQQMEIVDVRDILAEGKDPLKQITNRFKEVKSGSVLCIINTFIPIPLIRLLERGGVQSYTDCIHDKEYRTYFLKSNELKKATDKEQKVFLVGKQEFDDIHARYTKEQVQEIDVRNMEMPLPMQTILQLLPTLINGHILYVHHKKVPLYLLEELADQDYKIFVRNIEEGNVKLLISRIRPNE